MTGNAAAVSLWSVRTFLAWLVLACLLPGIIGATGLFVYEYREGRAQLEKDTIQIARALSQAVDNQIMRVQALAQGLATSGFVASGDFARFHRQALQALEQSRLGVGVSLTDRNGRQIVNTGEPFGNPLPPHGSQEIIRQVFQSNAPVVSNLFQSQVLQRPVMAVAVPVPLDGKTVYALTVSVPPERFNDILNAQGLPAGRVATIFDRTGIIVARSRASERFVGEKPAEGYFQELMESNEGTFEAVMKDGVAVLAAYTRSGVTDWRLAISIPRKALAARLTHRLSLLAAGIAGLFAIGLALAWLMGGKLAGSFQALVAPAVALGAGERVPPPPTDVREAAELAAALERAAELLQARTAALRETNQSLRDKERELAQVNTELEKRVQERTAQLEQSNEALMRSNIELEHFAHAAAHDLQTPLRSIAGFAQLLQQELGKQLNEQTGEWLAQVIDNTRRLQTLILELLAYSRLDAQARPFEPIDLEALFDQVLASLAVPIEEAGAEVSRGPLPRLVADRSQMAQLLENLIENGIKYNRSKPPRVSVTGSRRGDEWVFAVADNGIGIDPRHHKRIFEIFRRLHSHREFPGTGIGLAICQRIVEHHGGRIWVESQPGQGCVFRFSLPVRPGEDGP